MSDNLHSDSSENSAEDDSGEDPYADSHGVPLKCPKCDTYVALHYHPQRQFPGPYSGFVVHCECSAGPTLNEETVEWLVPDWYVDVVQESEERAEDWLDIYLRDEEDAEEWTGGDEDE